MEGEITTLSDQWLINALLAAGYYWTDLPTNSYGYDTEDATCPAGTYAISITVYTSPYRYNYAGPEEYIIAPWAPGDSGLL